MPARPRFHLSPTAWTSIACLAGVLGGRLLASPTPGFGGWLLLQGIQSLARIALATGECLALPLLFACIVTGADGLEPMRGVTRLGWKTGAWIVGSSGAAALLGLLVGRSFHPASASPLSPGKYLLDMKGWDNLPLGEIWIACLLIALALGVYRNQIEDTRARLLFRFALALDEALTLFLDWAAVLLPGAVFCVALTSSANFAWTLDECTGPWKGLLGALLAGAAMYGLVLLPLVLWIFARLPPWRYALAVGPAVLAALAGGSPAQVFPLTLTRVRVQGGISNRVASVVLGGCTAVLRDGHALGWAVAGAWLMSSAPAQTWPGLRIFLTAWLLGCAGGTLNGVAGGMLILHAGAITPAAANPAFLLAAYAIIGPVGNALSVFSQACAVAVIARSEGESNLLPPPLPTLSFADIVGDTSLP